MKIEIIGKEFVGNKPNKTNTLYFKVDGVGSMLEITYLRFREWDNLGKEIKRNVYVDGQLYRDFEAWFKSNYDGDFELFKQALMYELYQYSRGVNLDKLENVDISSIKRRNK